MLLNSVCNYNLAIEKFFSVGIPGKLLFLGILFAQEMRKAEVILPLNSDTSWGGKILTMWA